MFIIDPTVINTKTFNIKSLYQAEETYNYQMEIFNHISKTGISIDLVDKNPWVKDIVNSSTISGTSETIFNDDYTYYIKAISESVFIYNNVIKIDGIEYEFTPSTDINNTNYTILNDNYIIAYNDNGGKISVIDASGNTLMNGSFTSNGCSNINIHSVGLDTIVIGYYDEVLNKSFLVEVLVSTTITSYLPTLLYDGQAYNISINKISDIKFIITYNSINKGVIQVASVSNDHIFSVGYPFIFNNDITVFSNSCYQDGNVVVIYYDLDEQLKVKNCQIYDDYIAIGLPTIIKDSYCYDLNVKKLDDNYVYFSYYDAENMVISTGILKVDSDITYIDSILSFDDWNEGLSLTTLSDTQYMISYMDSDYKGVYRLININKVYGQDIRCDYNQFDIDLTPYSTVNMVGYNDYWIKYNNVIVEKGVCYINGEQFTYNI